MYMSIITFTLPLFDMLKEQTFLHVYNEFFADKKAEWAKYSNMKRASAYVCVEHISV